MGVPLFLFVADVFVVANIAWRLLCAFKLDQRGLVESTLAWLVLGLGVVVSSGVVLGWCGWLGANGFVLAHHCRVLGCGCRMASSPTLKRMTRG